MRRCDTVVAVLTFMALSLSFALSGIAQENSGVTAKNGVGNAISDREKAGLRGPVRSVEEEQTYPAWTGADGRLSPEFKTWNKTEYNRDGRVTATWGRNSSREHGMEG